MRLSRRRPTSVPVSRKAGETQAPPQSGHPEDSPGGQPDGGIGRYREVVERAVVNGGDDGGAGKGRAEILQQGASRPVVKALGRLVEQQQAGVPQVGLGDAQPAPLAAGEPLAARADLRLQVDLTGQDGYFHGRTELIGAGVRAGQPEVVRDSAAEQAELLATPTDQRRFLFRADGPELV